ncbi:MAG TPA: caspase family protein, partial [Thermotogota bacterium]|nr:caspase family protein [Thermotogota bacterium]
MKEKLLLVGMVLLVGMMYATDYAIVVGMNEYRWLNNLRYAEADAEQVGEKLKGLGFNAQILTGRVSDSDIIEEIRYMSMYTNRNDTLLFYFSGHGMPGDSESERGLCTYNTDPDRGSYVVTQQQLKEALENFAGTKIVILDACYQGSEERNLARDNELLDRKLGQQVDLLVTSSAANQGAHDGFWLGNQFIQNGVVGYYLQQALAGEADLNRDGALSADEMSRYLLGYADFMAKENGQNMEVKYKDRNQRLLVLGTGAVQPQRPVVSPPAASSSGSSRVPEGMVLVEGGSFEMGNTRRDSEGDNDEKPVHRVELTYDYLIGK